MRTHHRYYRQHWIRYGVIPFAIWALYVTVGFGDHPSISSHILLIVFVAWGLEHIAFQHYGILQVYHARQGIYNMTSNRLERLVFTLIVLSATLLSALQIPLISPWLSGLTLNQWVILQSTILAILIAISIFHALIVKQNRAAIIYFIVAAASMTYWPIYQSLGGTTSSWVLFFVIYDGIHCISYLGLVYYMNESQRLKHEQSGLFSIRRMILFWGPLAGLSSALLLAIMIYHHTISWPVTEWSSSLNQGYILGALQGFFMVHYYLESICWCYRDPHIRDTNFALLKPI
jgi:hypothetical protein